MDGERVHEPGRRYETIPCMVPLLGRRMGEVGGNRKVDGRKMERNSSIASEGSVDLCGAGCSATKSHLHAPEPLMQQQECIGACRSSEIWARGVDIPRRCARGDGTIAFRRCGRFALCVVVRGIVGQLEPVERLCGGRDEADGRPGRGTVEDGGGVVLGVRSGRSEPHWAGGYEDDVFVRIIGHCWCTGESRM